MRDKKKIIRRNILRNILKCLGITIILSIIGLCIVFSSEREGLEGMQAVTLLILFAIGIAIIIALFSFGALFATAQFIYTDKMLFTLVYFFSTLFVSFFICVITFKFDNSHDKIIAVPLIPVCSYILLWTFFYFTLNKKSYQD
jgi:hypothetical protein